MDFHLLSVFDDVAFIDDEPLQGSVDLVGIEVYFDEVILRLGVDGLVLLVAGVGLNLEKEGAGRVFREVEADVVAGIDRAVVNHSAFLVKELVGCLEGHFVAVGRIDFDVEAGGVLQKRADRPFADLPRTEEGLHIVFVASVEHYAAAGVVLELNREADPVGYIDGVVETLSLAGRIGDGDHSLIPSGSAGRERYLEGAVRGRLDVLSIDLAAPAAYDGHYLRGGQLVAGVGDDAAAHGDLVSGEIEFVVAVEFGRECRENEFIHREIVGGDSAVVVMNFETEPSVAAACREGDLAGHAAEGVQRHLLIEYDIRLGIPHDNFRLLSFRKDCDLVHEVAFEKDGFEFQDVARMIGALVLVDVAMD